MRNAGLVWTAVCDIAGLKSHPQYELSKRQMRGYSGMVTFYIKGDEKEARTFLSCLKVVFIEALFHNTVQERHRNTHANDKRGKK